MKFKIQAGGTIDVATRDEVRQEIVAASASWFTEVARGDRYRRFSAFSDTDAAGNLVIGDRVSEGQLGPSQGFVWSVNRLAVGGGYDPNADDQTTLLTASNPGAGVGLVTFDVPAGETWELMAARYGVATSAAATSRIPELTLRWPGGADPVSISATTALAASASRTFNWWQGGSGAAGSGNLGMGLPAGLKLPGGSQIRMSVFGFDVADTITSASILVRKWAPPHSLALSIGNGDAGDSGLVVPELKPYNDLTGNAVILYPGDTMAVKGTAPAGKRIWVTGQARELPLSLAWRL